MPSGRERGSALVMTVVVVMVITIIAVGVVNFASREVSGAYAGARRQALVSCADSARQLLVSKLHAVGMNPTSIQALNVPLDATACELRRPGFNCVITNVWFDPGTTEANIAWTREAFEGLAPFGSSLRYVNYLSADELGDAQLRSVYGANLDRLRQVKRIYDPDNVFRQNLNIPPA